MSAELAQHWGDWESYFLAYRAQKEEGKQQERDDLRPRELLEAGHEVDWHEVVPLTKTGQPNSQGHLGKVVKLCLAHAWEFKVGRSRYYTGDHVQENGVVKIGKEKEHVWIQGMKGDRFFTYSAEYIRLNGKHIKMNELTRELEN